MSMNSSERSKITSGCSRTVRNRSFHLENDSYAEKVRDAFEVLAGVAKYSCSAIRISNKRVVISFAKCGRYTPDQECLYRGRCGLDKPHLPHQK